jgi:uncharacterized protein YhfF
MLPGRLQRSAETDAFWQAFRRHLGLDHDNYVVGSFGDTPEMATELADLAVAGIKRATASFALRASLAAAPAKAWHAITVRVAIRHRDPAISSSC